MSAFDSRGLFKGLRAKLAPADYGLFRRAFTHLEVIAAQRQVRDPGSFVLESYHREDAHSHELREYFQDRLVELLESILAGTPPNLCCRYHNHRASNLPDAVRRHDHWLMDFLEVLSVFVREAHYQLHSPVGLADPSLKLSRFMPLKTFIGAHTNFDPPEVHVHRFASELGHALPRSARMRAKNNRSLGDWTGQIGTYPSETDTLGGAATPYWEYCSVIKPFATLTDQVVPDWRQGAPDQMLKNIGVPFIADEFWIELVFEARNAMVMVPSLGKALLAIPTRMETGYWAFQPERDNPANTNFAINLENASRGFPELIHAPLSVGALHDFIVWREPTRADWTQPSSPLAA
jgi:hypothetical protein